MRRWRREDERYERRAREGGLGRGAREGVAESGWVCFDPSTRLRPCVDVKARRDKMCVCVRVCVCVCVCVWCVCVCVVRACVC